MTTYRPTVLFGADGNSGGKSAEEPAISGRKRLKVPKTVRKTFQPLFGTKISGVRFPSLRPTAAFRPQRQSRMGNHAAVIFHA